MLTIAICDDEIYMQNELNSKVHKYLCERGIGVQISCFSNGLALLHAGAFFHVIIMDIKMPSLDGMEVIHRLRERGTHSQVIFVTSCKDSVFKAFDVDAVHYLVKPVADQDLFHALDKAVMRCEEVDAQTVTITKGTAVEVIPFREILYCEAIDHKIYIHTLSGRFDCYSKLDALHTQLDDRFFRCHRSYLVNLHFVSGKDGDTAIMTNGDRILVSRRKQQQFSQQLLSFIRGNVL